MTVRPHAFRTNGAPLAALLILTGYAGAQTASLTTLYEFKGPPDGANPSSGLVTDGAALYGTTVVGGIINTSEDQGRNGCGTVFALTPPAAPDGPWTEQILHSFAGGADGCGPANGVVIGSGGVLYGTTSDGLIGGTAFSLTPPTTPAGPWTETVLYTFNGGCQSLHLIDCPPGGSFGAGPPYGLVIGKGGALFGASFYGGAYCESAFGEAGCGAVFWLTPPLSPGGPWTEGFYSIGGGALDGPDSGLALGGSGVLYGSTAYGGKYCCGALFALAPPASPGATWTQTLIHSFGNPNIREDGQTPGADVVIDSSGVIYGITGSGGLGAGEVYSLTPPVSPGGDWTYAILYFPPSTPHGSGPSQLTLGPDGVLYSAVRQGGASMQGTVFSLTPPASPGSAWTETTLYIFTGGSDPFPNGGLLIGPGGLLFGTTAGAYPTPPNVGTVFVLEP
jgi:hypothetical protein